MIISNFREVGIVYKKYSVSLTRFLLNIEPQSLFNPTKLQIVFFRLVIFTVHFYNFTLGFINIKLSLGRGIFKEYLLGRKE